MQTYTIVIPGRPRPKERPRLGAKTYTPKATKDHQDVIGQYANIAMRGAMFPGPVSISIVFFVHGKSGDIDNLAKAALDGMNGIVYADDVQIKDLRLRLLAADGKHNQGTIIIIQELNPSLIKHWGKVFLQALQETFGV